MWVLWFNYNDCRERGEKAELKRKRAQVILIKHTEKYKHMNKRSKSNSDNFQKIIQLLS
jgi:hypothetical protein